MRNIEKQSKTKHNKQGSSVCPLVQSNPNLPIIPGLDVQQGPLGGPESQATLPMGVAETWKMRAQAVLSCCLFHKPAVVGGGRGDGGIVRAGVGLEVCARPHCPRK